MPILILAAIGASAVVHNGMISNHEEIRKGLRDRGHHFFFSDTDSEVIVHLMEEVYRRGLFVEQAFVRMLRHLEGTFAIAMISTHEPRKIFCARQKSPLILGIGSETRFVSSDINAFLPHTRQALPLDDGEYAVLSSDAYWIKDIATGDEPNRHSYGDPTTRQPRSRSLGIRLENEPFLILPRANNRDIFKLWFFRV